MTTRRYTVIPGLGVPGLLVLMVVQVLVCGHDARAQASLHPARETLVGTWRVEVTPVDCQTRKPIAEPGMVLHTYVREGSVLAAAVPIAPPALGAPLTEGQGIWERTGQRSFRAFFIFFRFDLEGTLLGTLEVTNATIALGEHADIFTEPDSRVRTLDANGTEIATSCVTVIGRRLTFER